MKMNKTKLTATIAIILLTTSAFTVMLNLSVKAQDEGVPAGYWEGIGGFGSLPLPSGVTPDVEYETIAHISFRPNPIGVGQPLLVNMWLQPPTYVARYQTGYTVTLTKPDGTDIVVGPLDSFLGDTSTYFEYIMNEVGTWQVTFNYPGGYFPAGNYTVPEGQYYGGRVLEAPLSIYYKPSSDGPYDLVVQDEQVLSWPPAELPTDYWTRPASIEVREWWPILGNYPPTGIVAGVGRGVTLDVWPANTNKYMSNYDFVPYVQGPKSAHILWKQQGDVGGLIGGTMGIASYKNRGASPEIVFAGRAYDTITKVFDGVTQRVWQCYDIQTGEVYWEKTDVAQIPNMIMYSEREVDVVPGETASTESIRTELMYVGGGRLITYDPWDGSVNIDIEIDPLSSGDYYASYDWPYFLTVQNLGGGEYRLINWTIGGDPSGFRLGNFHLGVLSNVSFPFSSYNVADYETMIGVRVDSITPSSTGVAYAQRLMGVSLTTGKLLWNVTTDETIGTQGAFSRSTAVADHGKFAMRLNDGHWHCWSLYNGQELWVGELSSWPWGTFGCYGSTSYGGNIISNQYDGVVAYDWNTGKISWWYKDKVEYPYETPFGDNYPWFTGTIRIADDVIYDYNTEHSPSQPIMRGERLHAINATTGEGIWNITGSMSPGAVAGGYLTASDSYDGYMYVFGKGKSETAVTAAPKAIAKGSQVVIEGTVLDLSPGQPGTPCVSKDSMATQMEYLHMQHPIAGLDGDAIITGVPVSLSAMDESGNHVVIGTTTTNGYFGTFGFEWTPPDEGKYEIIATFLGDDSYGSSGAATYVVVGPAPASDVTPEPTPEPGEPTQPIISTEAALIIVVGLVAAVAIIAYVVMRRPKK
jgi:hypothetical protein